MIAIRGNFFYTRSVPCELWFLNKDKPKQHVGKVLMLDARGVFRKITRKIFDFSQEQLANLTAIVWLFRGQSERFLALVADHLANAIKASNDANEPLVTFIDALEEACEAIAPSFKGKKAEAFAKFDELVTQLQTNAASFAKATTTVAKAWEQTKRDNKSLKVDAEGIAAHGELGHKLAKEIDHAAKLFSRLVEEVNGDNGKSAREVKQAAKLLEETRGSSASANWCGCARR